MPGVAVIAEVLKVLAEIGFKIADAVAKRAEAAKAAETKRREEVRRDAREAWKGSK